MKENMPTKSSEKRQRSTRRSKRDDNKHSYQGQQVEETTSSFRTIFPKSERQPHLDFEKEAADVFSMMQSGGLQGTAGAKASASESISELFEEGQDLESELLQGGA
jgi:hypothetical protein